MQVNNTPQPLLWASTQDGPDHLTSFFLYSWKLRRGWCKTKITCL